MTHVLKLAHARPLVVAIATLLALAACDGGDDYTEDGQLVEKTDVRVVGVDFGRTVDSLQRLRDTTHTFATTDHISAAVRTKGSSTKTTLGVRFRNATGFEVGGSNVWIRPTGDTSTTFSTSVLTGWEPGQYTMDVRVNGKVVTTANFTVNDQEAAAMRASVPDASPGLDASPGPVLADTSGISGRMISKARSALSSARSEFSRLAFRAAVLIGREPKDQSPFEWKGLRAGMRFAKVDRVSHPAGPWKRTPFLMSILGCERGTAFQNTGLGAGRLTILIDTVADRVLEVNYSPTRIPNDSTQKRAFEREMVAVGLEWDKMPGVIREQHGQSTSGYSFAWGTPDSVWRATISYDESVRRAGRPTGLQIEELHWNERMFEQMSDSMKGQMRNPNSEYYHPRPPAPNAPPSQWCASPVIARD